MFYRVLNTQRNFYLPETHFKSTANLASGSLENRIFYKNLDEDSLELKRKQVEIKSSKLSPKYESMLNYINGIDYHLFDIRRASDTLINHVDRKNHHTYIINYEEFKNSGEFRAETIYKTYQDEGQVNAGFGFAEESVNKREANTIYKILVAKTLIGLNHLDEYYMDPDEHNLTRVTKDDKFKNLVIHLSNTFVELSENYRKISKDYPENSEQRKLKEAKAAKAQEYAAELVAKLFKEAPPEAIKLPVKPLKPGYHNVDFLFRRFLPFNPKWKAPRETEDKKQNRITVTEKSSG